VNIQNAKKPVVAVMNAVHDLPVLVARDKGFFKDEGLDLEFVTTPGMAQITTSHIVKFDSIFDRPLDSVYNEGGIDQYRMCEWGIMKRAVEANAQHLRGRKIVALGASMSKFAIVVAGDSKFYEPEMLKDKDIAVTPNNGSHFTTLKMLEGFLTPEHIKTTSAGTMPQRLEALRQGTVAAVSLMEPWISVAQKQGLRILIESHSSRSEAAGDDLDGPTLAAMFRAQARAVKLLERSMHSSTQLPVCLSILLMASFAALSLEFGFEAVLGGFETAGGSPLYLRLAFEGSLKVFARPLRRWRSVGL